MMFQFLCAVSAITLIAHKWGLWQKVLKYVLFMLVACTIVVGTFVMHEHFRGDDDDWGRDAVVLSEAPALTDEDRPSPAAQPLRPAIEVEGGCGHEPAC